MVSFLPTAPMPHFRFHFRKAFSSAGTSLTIQPCYRLRKTAYSVKLSDIVSQSGLKTADAIGPWSLHLRTASGGGARCTRAGSMPWP
jgi:hypothetical protein